jgi:glycine cleavage system regulatory protein
MTAMIFTIVGKDKPGLISSLAQTVYDLQGNWLGSSLSHMAGHFAGFVQIELPPDKHSQLIEIFSAHPDLKIHLLPSADSDEVHTEQAKIELTGNDRAGIVQELTHVLHQFNLNVVKFDSSCESAPNWGGSLFKATAVIAIAEDFDLVDLTERLEAVANDLMVDIEKITP